MKTFQYLLPFIFLLPACGHDPGHGGSSNTPPPTVAPPTPRPPSQPENVIPPEPIPPENIIPPVSPNPEEEITRRLSELAIEVSFEQNFERGDNVDNFWRFNATHRLEFYERGVHKIKKFFVVNRSTEPTLLNFADLVSSGQILQFVSKWRWLGTEGIFTPPTERLRQTLELDLPTFVELYRGSGQALSPTERFVVGPNEIITGFLICDFSRLPIRYFPQPRHEGNRFVHNFTQWTVYRVEMNFQFGFSVKASLTEKTASFYDDPKHWRTLFEKDTETLSHRSDHEFNPMTAEGIHSQSTESQIAEFSEPGLYIMRR